MSETTEKLFRTPQDALVFAFNYSMHGQGRPLVDRLAAPSPRTGKGLSGNDGAGQAGMVRRFIDGSDSVEYLRGLWEWARENYTRAEIDQLEEAGQRGLIFLEEQRRCSSVYVELAQLTIVERAVVVARFAPKSFQCHCRHACCSGYTPNPEWRDAIRDLTHAALTPLAGHLSHHLVRRKLIEQVFDVKVNLEQLAEKASVSKNTVTAHRKIIKLWLSGQKAQPAKGTREALPAVDGIESAARKKIDNLLSSREFVGAPE
ncbi:hypothetical protein [Paraburkholderia acidiphila]|uniref:Uncharacterized protein n=1 Tax=Paraburkholderia acidiphila TaxID=2571747 RepID=A0A7Z2JAR6_9BURK|nr:hypothetical protein [Paraburkholderia acidiphila]QGZ56739.1 hypothetical protein FAZ97_17395 [Paraburkholderia acidiphila]